MRILAVLSTMDLRYGLGCTPVWWQLLKGLYETECEITAIPYLGAGIESLWWKAEDNPCEFSGRIYYSLSHNFFPRGAGKRTPENLVGSITKATTRQIWIRKLRKTLNEKGPFDCLIFFNVPINQIKGLPTELRKEFGIKIVYYDGDMPSILPETNAQRGFIFNYYEGADLTEYDLFLVNSEGVIPELIARGAREVRPLHYAADPEFFSPVPSEKKWDVAFFGFGSKSREKWMTRMIAEPSISGQGKFVVAGEGFEISLGRAAQIGIVPTNGLRRYCCSSHINLNITASTHADIFGSSTARPFELAAMGSCIVSCPYNGMEKWFVNKKEMWILSENENASEVYEMLLSDEDTMAKMGEAARKRLLKDHTYKARALQMQDYIHGTKQS